MDERLGRGHGRFVVVEDPAVAAEPGEGPLDAPQRLERDEPVRPFGTSPDVDGDAESRGDRSDQADVGGVGEHLDEPGELRFRGFEEGLPATGAVWLGAGDTDSGRIDRHRLNRGGDRAANCALYQIVLCRLRYDLATQAYTERRTKQGLSKPEIIRCLKRYVLREVYRTLVSAATPREDRSCSGRLTSIGASPAISETR